MDNKPRILTGIIVGALTSAALVALFYLAAGLFGTPFVPFDVFDWVGRVLPGPIITFGIDTLVSVVQAVNPNGDLSTNAKTAEQLLAIAGLIVTGMIGGGVLFALLRRGTAKGTYLPGILLGLVVGIPVMLISLSVNFNATANPVVSAAWIILAFLGWGVAINWSYTQLLARDASVSEEVVQVDRRRFLVTLGGATAAITVVGTGLGVLLGRSPEEAEPLNVANALGQANTEGTETPRADLPNANAAVQPAPGTRPEYTPLRDHYRIDINAAPPSVDGATWVLPFTGLVDEEVQMTLAELRSNYEPVDQYVTLACISNPIAGDLIGTTLWTGVPFHKVLEDVPLKPEATHLRITAADGFDEIVALETIMTDERVMLAYAWDGQPLTVPHGFPLRIYIPNHYGMKQPKWITGIEAIGEWEEGYWVRRGWDKDALMRATSVIDTVAVDDIISDGDTQLVPIGGIAHAGDRGISKVEVQVDGGEWQEAQLRDPLSQTTWVIWRYDWPFAEGEHTFAVRCTEGDGTPQIDTPASTRPSGATGIDTKRATL